MEERPLTPDEPESAPALPELALEEARAISETAPPVATQPQPVEEPAGWRRAIASHRLAIAAAGGMAALAITAALIFRPEPADATDALETPSAAAEAPAPPPACAPLDDVRLVRGAIDEVPLAEALRTGGIEPGEIYRIRQAFEGVDGWAAAKGGRFVVALGDGGKAEGFELVVSAEEVYRARVDAAGKLAGERSASGPCFDEEGGEVAAAKAAHVDGEEDEAEDAPKPRRRPARADADDEPPAKGGAGRTVAQAASASCSTSIVSGLSRQIIAEARCLNPDAFVKVPARKNLVAGSNVVLYLEAPARDHLLRALDAHPELTMTVNSALRTIAQQVLLSQWGAKKRCGVKLAATPGESNHESGLALDVSESSAWRKALEKEGFRWYGSKDPVHFDYAGPGAVDHRGLDVRAFQRLWTRNHPDDPLAETGRLDARTSVRLSRSPASGFPVGARCSR
jgi:hypothetical protein